MMVVIVWNGNGKIMVVIVVMVVVVVAVVTVVCGIVLAVQMMGPGNHNRRSR